MPSPVEFDTAVPDTFESWANGAILHGDLSQPSVDKYRALWLAWRGWLLLRGVDWDRVTGVLVEEFLQGPAPGQGGRRPAINTHRMSSYTRQRYWRLLRGVYATAAQAGVMASSPLLEVPDQRRPTISSRDRLSQVLEPQLFERLQVPKTIESIITVKTAADWWHRRDRAMLALLVETGVTTSELIALRGKDLKRVDRVALEVGVASSASDNPISLQLDVLDAPGSVGRTLRISDRYSYLLLEWLGFRRVLLSEWITRVAEMEEGASVKAGHGDESPLFLARRARIGGDELPALEAVTVYYAVSKALNKLRSQVLPPMTAPSVGVVPDAPHVAKGPAVIRNSVIRAWLDSVGPVETVRRAGLQNVDSLRLPARVVKALS